MWVNITVLISSVGTNMSIGLLPKWYIQVRLIYKILDKATIFQYTKAAYRNGIAIYVCPCVYSTSNVMYYDTYGVYRNGACFPNFHFQVLKKNLNSRLEEPRSSFCLSFRLFYSTVLLCLVKWGRRKAAKIFIHLFKRHVCSITMETYISLLHIL